MARRTGAFIFSALLLAGTPGVRAGGNLEQINLNGLRPSPIAGDILADLVGIRWDTRTLPVRYRVNTSLDPIPNPLGAPFVTVASLTPVLQASLDLWNTIPTSFVNMQVVGTLLNNGQAGFDMKNEVTFRTTPTFNAIAVSPSISLIIDSEFVNGDDLDGDGDSDVSSAITTAQDVDGDQDIEFPAGIYAAGTILDNDVAFNTKPLSAGANAGFRFTLTNAELDTNTRSVDLMCVAVHEFGHSFGLSHSLENQESITIGMGATMFPAIDTGDPDAEREQRTPNSDDIAWASYLYPEGTAAAGPAAWEAGDVPFATAYGLITGEARHGRFNEPLLAGNVYAIDRATNRRVASTFSGSGRVSFRPATGQLFVLPPAVGIAHGRYAIPVPKGSYAIGIEPLDGNPAGGGNISLTGQLGAIYGHPDFTEELFNNQKEAAFEKRASQGKNVVVHAGLETAGVDIVTNNTIHIDNFGSQNSSGFTGAPAGRLYAVRVPASQVTTAFTAAGGLASVLAANISTNTADASVPVRFAEALFTTGTINPATGAITSINFADPIEREAPFQAEENDHTPWFFKNPHVTGQRVADLITAGADQFFIIVRVPHTPFPGVSNLPPLIGIDGPTNVPATPNDVPNFGLSYFSDDGGATWTRREDFNFRFGLVIAPTVP
jgi:hypothetical protein